MTWSQVPVLIGQGATLFGPLPADISLGHVRTDVLGGGMVQTKCLVQSDPDAPTQ